MNDSVSLLPLMLGLPGGLALFIFGMQTMSRALSSAVGEGTRGLIAKGTKNRMAGIGLGTGIGFLIQSSASTVLYIGFINAGLMTLRQTIAPMLGANIGTTLSIQLISFRLADYCLGAVFLGLVAHLIGRTPRLRNGGLALLGFGLLFLGMQTMSEAVQPHRELFQPWLAHVNGSTTAGLLKGTLLAALATAIVQSSGAVIGMAFAMVSAGVIHDLQGIYPVVIGANIGTCVTGLLGSIGTTIEARRLAMAHLLFNCISTAAAVIAASLFYRFIPLTANDVIHQAANANTIKMLLSALLILPVAPWFAQLTEWLTPSKKRQPEPSHLDESLLDRPERAILACLYELRRISRMCVESLHWVGCEFEQHDHRHLRRIKTNEQSINAVKATMRTYLAKLSERYLSRRQAILIEHVDRCMSDLERIGDHVANLHAILERQRRHPAAGFAEEPKQDLAKLHDAAQRLLDKLVESLDPETESFVEMGEDILALRKAFRATAQEVQQRHFDRIEQNATTPLAGIIFNDYLSNYVRMAKHIKTIALAEQHPRFWIKRTKLSKVVDLYDPGLAQK